jgi:hypothetical protein
MSVYRIANAELAELRRRLQPVAPIPADLDETLYAIGLANRAAYDMTYGHDASVEPLSLDVEPDAFYPVIPEWSITTWVANLLYNGVSNGGRDFVPAQDRRAITDLANRADARIQPLRLQR